MSDMTPDNIFCKQTAAALRENEEHFRLLLKDVPVTVALQDRDLRFLWAFNLCTIPPAEIIGKTDRDLFPPETAERLISLKRRVLETGTELHEQLWLTSGGKRLFLDLFLEPWRDAAGGIAGIRIATVDLSTMKSVQEALAQSERNLREKEERLAHALEAGELGSWSLDAQTGQAWRSPQHDRIFGYEKPLPEWTYHRFLEHVLPEDRAEVDRKFGQAISESTEWNFECRICRIDGEIRWIRAQGRPRLNERNETVQMVGLVKDITENKKIEAETLRIKEELERRVLVRTNHLRALTLELTLAEQRERKRLAGVLHDNLQQLLVGVKWGVQDAQRKARDKDFRQSLKQTAALLDEAVLASKSLAVELSPPILHESGLVAAFKWLARWMKEKHDLTVQVVADLEIQPDTEGVCQLLFQSVRELLFNVVKHSQTKAADIAISAVPGQQVEIRVSDRGVGFKAAESQSRSAETGYGLFSIRERLSLLGGRMTIESSPGTGTVVTLLAPLPKPTPLKRTGPERVVQSTEAEQKERKDPGAIPGCGSKIRILVVDDHKIMREGLSRLLQSLPDMEVVGEAPDGKTALDMAKELQPNIVIMDISMPCMNGIEATRCIAVEAPDVRVIGLSMYEEEDQAREMLEAGAVDYFNKAGPAQGLVASIREHHRGSKGEE